MEKGRQNSAWKGCVIFNVKRCDFSLIVKLLFLCRKSQMEANWSEYKAEEDHRERIRRSQEAKKKQKVVWDDADERKCQQRYRQKYSSTS